MNVDAYPAIAADSIGWVSEEQMIEVDRVMIDDLGIGLLQMMENAGRNLAHVFAIDVFAPTSVSVLAGSGGNGGGGLVAARHLTNAGVDVTVTTTRGPDGLTGVPAHQSSILRRMGVEFSAEVVDADLTIDALIGYSLRGAPVGRSAELINTIDGRVILSLDTPSGLDVTAGGHPGAVVDAAATMTLALPKTGLRNAPEVGMLVLADISVPRSVAEALGPAAPDFRASPIVRIA